MTAFTTEEATLLHEARASMRLVEAMRAGLKPSVSTSTQSPGGYKGVAVMEVAEHSWRALCDHFHDAPEDARSCSEALVVRVGEMLAGAGPRRKRTDVPDEVKDRLDTRCIQWRMDEGEMTHAPRCERCSGCVAFEWMTAVG